MSLTFFVSGPITRNCTGKPTGGPKLNRSTRTRASDSAPLATAPSSRALIRSRASLRSHHDFGERLVGQLRIEAEPKARRAAADIGGVGRNIGIGLEQLFSLLDRFQRRSQGRADSGKNCCWTRPKATIDNTKTPMVTSTTVTRRFTHHSMTRRRPRYSRVS